MQHDFGAGPERSVLLYCRAGFEPECAAEIAVAAARAAVGGYPVAERGEGFVRFVCVDDAALASLIHSVPLRTLIFSRQKLRAFARFDALPERDRLGPMLEAVARRGAMHGDLFVEHPDADPYRELAGLTRSFGNALRPALRQRGLLSAAPDASLPALHVLFLGGHRALLALGSPGDSRPWPQGIPRLRVLRSAPSRSAAKLDEALLTLLEPGERERWLKPGMKAADLGAAPGGWSWVLARLGIHVTAIDNGPLAETALATGLVHHVRADGFSWQPPQPLDWLVCDMVEQPRRVAARMADWFVNGWCRRAIFNLKLPMKKRYAEVEANLADFVGTCADSGKAVEWRARQLYHDREEITVYAGSAP